MDITIIVRNTIITIITIVAFVSTVIITKRSLTMKKKRHHCSHYHSH